MFSKKTYRRSRWMERIIDAAGVPSTDLDFSASSGWQTVRPEYLVEIHVGTHGGKEWRKVQFMRMKGPISFSLVTEQSNWVDITWMHRKAVRVTQLS